MVGDGFGTAAGCFCSVVIISSIRSIYSIQSLTEYNILVVFLLPVVVLVLWYDVEARSSQATTYSYNSFQAVSTVVVVEEVEAAEAWSDNIVNHSVKSSDELDGTSCNMFEYIDIYVLNIDLCLHSGI